VLLASKFSNAYCLLHTDGLISLFVDIPKHIKFGQVVNWTTSAGEMTACEKVLNCANALFSYVHILNATLRKRLPVLSGIKYISKFKFKLAVFLDTLKFM
jgi:hypothetical protein